MELINAFRGRESYAKLLLVSGAVFAASLAIFLISGAMTATGNIDIGLPALVFLAIPSIGVAGNSFIAASIGVAGVIFNNLKVRRLINETLEE